MSTWYSKHVEESNNIWRINNIQCITLVVLYGQFLMHGQRNIKLNSFHVIFTDSFMQVLCQLISNNGIFSSEIMKILFMKRLATSLNSETMKDLFGQEFLDKEWLKALLSRFKKGGDLYHHSQKSELQQAWCSVGGC